MMQNISTKILISSLTIALSIFLVLSKHLLLKVANAEHAYFRFCERIVVFHGIDMAAMLVCSLAQQKQQIVRQPQ